MRTAARRGTLGLAALLVLLAGLVVLSARAGGPVSWHVTAGSSMQPQISPGTLVVVARQASYAVGDVVAYRSEQLGKVVLHRVVRVEGERLVLQGDANSWLDPDQPLQTAALGARVVQIPGVGTALAWIRSPAVLGGAGALSALSVLGAGHSRRGRRGDVIPAVPAPTWRRLPVPAGVEAGLAAGVTGCVLLTVLATAGPLVSDVATRPTARHTVAWSYTAQASQGLVYDDGLAETGDTLYNRLVQAADVTAQLRVDAPERAQVRGTWRLDVAVEDDNGWRRTAVSGAPAPVSARSSQLTATVPVAELLDLARRASEESGVTSGQRRLTVRAVLDLVVDADGAATPAQAAPELVFAADAAKVWLLDPTQLEQSASLALPHADTVARLGLGGASVPAPPARLAGITGAGVLLLLLLLLRLARRSETEDERIARTSRHLLVPMDNLAEPDLTVDVSTFAALADIAASYERKVLFGDCAGLRVYLVLDDGVAYRYYCAATAARLDERTPRVPSQRSPQPATSRL